MISIEEAQRTILDFITPLETEKVSLFQGLNRVTPEDHIPRGTSRRPTIPPWTGSHSPTQRLMTIA